MQSINRKTRSSLAAVIGSCAANNFWDETEMNTSMHDADAAIKPALSAAPINRQELSPTETRLLAAVARLNDKTGKFMADLAESLMDSPLHAKFARPSLHLVQGGAA